MRKKELVHEGCDIIHERLLVSQGVIESVSQIGGNKVDVKKQREYRK